MEEKVKKSRQKFSEEFKKESVELAHKIGCSEAAKSLGINEANIRQWRAKRRGTSQSGDQKSYSELERENRRLAKENSYLKEINNVLKKSTAIFSIDQLGNLK